MTHITHNQIKENHLDDSFCIDEAKLYSRLAFLQNSTHKLTVNQVLAIAEILNLPEAYLLTRDDQFAQSILELFKEKNNSSHI